MDRNQQLVKASPESICRAGEMLIDGELVAFPTETVYGLGADATNSTAVAKVYEAKKRPSHNPLIVHVNGLAMARSIGELSGIAIDLANKFWPGPLTLIVPRTSRSAIAKNATGGLETIAIRAPDHPVAQKLINEVARPIAAPSANISGTVSPTTAQHVVDSLGSRVKLVLDGGPCRIGIESTIVQVVGQSMRILRLGSISQDQIEQATGKAITPPGSEDQPIASPGSIGRHYAPLHPLRLNAKSVGHGEVLLAFGPDQLNCIGRTLNLSSAADINEAAANLFSMLRELDNENCNGIAVMPIPNVGTGAAINERLRRASQSDPGDDQ